ncbi:mechanosensitive ion channel family protein [Mucilaginibacter jinjuensis]|uniref:Mechanosensitive ion channel n=1 Tax=Mucilaginibacter jinjuensis TaxID=1176721 RepID=A0ABY7T146_9SPHI|nr:mechanosensitive ion channel domain-containing protein [Mucilaginibacter jinjuensis]WCT10111.1 mechanosensitive ion channel [Mucilaginibacter jinjuensis]
MQKHLKYLFLVLLTGALVCSFTDDGFGQLRRKKRTQSDSLRASILHRDSMMRTLKRSDTSLNMLLQKVEYYNNSFTQISVTLSHGFDTLEISKQLPSFQKRVTIVKNLIDQDKSNTLRYLYAIRDILTRAEDQLDEWQDQLADINSKLVQMRSDLNEIKKDSTFSTVPADTSLQQTANQPIKAVMSKHKQLDSLNKVNLLKIGLLQNRVADIYISILDQKDRLNIKIRNFGEQAFSSESNYIWDMKATPGTTFASALDDTINMNYKLLKFMISREMVMHFVGFFILALFFIWVFANRRKISNTRTDPHKILLQTNYVARHPMLSAIIVCMVIQPYFYDHPPAVFLEGLFLIATTCVLLLVRKVFPPTLYKFLRTLFFISIIYAISNLFVETSNVDRVIVLIVSGYSAFIGYRFLRDHKEPEEFPPYWRIILKIFVVLQVISFVFNVSGRFTLAKITAVTGNLNLWLAFALYLFVQILMESLFLQLEANKSDTGISSFLDFKLLQSKFRSILNKAAVLMWAIMLAQNLGVEDNIWDWLTNLMQISHNLGGTQFTLGSIVVFIVVIWLSSVAAKIINYFYDFAGQHKGTQPQKRKNKTSMLLVRISVFAVGFFIAVAASGVPMDKITIIISAFGVGIGFGLQNIVNNLVSGLILAFEKPVEIGDVIEVSGKSGTIKEIGIRSSKLLTGDGAEVIIPNGDLISQHVINWTLSNSNRRVELIIGVAYGSDVEKVKEILKKLLTGRDDIMLDPAPVVLLHNLNASSVDFRMLFWAADIAVWQELKSRILAEVYTTFAAEGISLPFPQQDVHLYWDKDAELPLPHPSPVSTPSTSIAVSPQPTLAANKTEAKETNLRESEDKSTTGKTDEGPDQ